MAIHPNDSGDPPPSCPRGPAPRPALLCPLALRAGRVQAAGALARRRLRGSALPSLRHAQRGVQALNCTIRVDPDCRAIRRLSATGGSIPAPRGTSTAHTVASGTRGSGPVLAARVVCRRPPAHCAIGPQVRSLVALRLRRRPRCPTLLRPSRSPPGCPCTLSALVAYPASRARRACATASSIRCARATPRACPLVHPDWALHPDSHLHLHLPPLRSQHRC